ncbi:FecR family protein [Aestuariibaculum sediminum]|uniref:FecR family protein n=1 Tax=Aestuariibaculum sediminum TaxID=2770637 RepID=A0A8J6Q0L8_9FLAO|nr:FecR family protein [Aestuariibaculum sediminum]MBD0832567.1 FecR family protein [Aestuariibaculum sediminum]
MQKNSELIIQKYLNDEITYRELCRLTSDIPIEQLHHEIKKSIEINYLLSQQHLKVDSSQETYLNILAQAKSQKKQKKSSKVIRLNSILKYAAIFVVLMGLTFALKLKYFNQNSSLTIEDQPIILELANGTKQKIDQNKTIKITNEKGLIIANQEEDKLSYKTTKSEEVLVYNTLKIPYGKKLKLELSDGSLITLNSGTTFKFPEHFLSHGQRKVFINGEAFFEIEKDKKRPFIVHVNDVNVEVLGTKFNVSSYPEDDFINTVLVSGSVKLSNNANSSIYEKILKPGERGSWNHSSKEFVVETVDTHLYTAWVDGKLLFRNMTFKNIRNKLERHYNVEIVNNNQELDNLSFLASFDIETIEEVIETFKRNYGINYQIKDNKIIIN